LKFLPENLKNPSGGGKWKEHSKGKSGRGKKVGRKSGRKTTKELDYVTSTVPYKNHCEGEETDPLWVEKKRGVTVFGGKWRNAKGIASIRECKQNSNMSACEVKGNTIRSAEKGGKLLVKQQATWFSELQYYNMYVGHHLKQTGPHSMKKIIIARDQKKAKGKSRHRARERRKQIRIAPAFRRSTGPSSVQNQTGITRERRGSSKAHWKDSKCDETISHCEAKTQAKRKKKKKDC